MPNIIATRLRLILVSMVAAVIIAVIVFLLWWHFALSISLNRVHAELRKQGIDSRWQDVADRELSSPEDIQRIDALFAAMQELGSTDAVEALLWRTGDDTDVDEPMTHHAALDHEAMAFISEELRQWHQLDPNTVRRWVAPSVHDINVMKGITARRSWALLSEARARLPLSKEDRVAAITSIAHLLALREEPLLIGMLVDISIAAIALGAMAEHQDLWEDHGEAFLTLMAPWCRPDYWQNYQLEASLNELRIASSVFDSYESSDDLVEGVNANGMQIRLSAAQALRDQGAGIRILRDHSGDLRELINAVRELDGDIHDIDGWWSRQRSTLTQEFVIHIHAALERWARVYLTYEVLRHEMGHGTWPEDPWAAPGIGLRRYPEQGPLKHVWSVGPDGIDQGGEWNWEIDGDDIDINWPQPKSDP